jgi:predicted GH43/DUF377 family glycosyl hydrolase
MTETLADAGIELGPDPSRVVARLFLPGEGFTRTGSRAAGIIERIQAFSPEQLAVEAAQLLAAFGDRHEDFRMLLERHAETVAFRSTDSSALGPDEAIVLGAAFTAEHSVEAAALCNPSAVVHPDQGGLEPGELRLAVALRAIGEGHVSSITFASAVVGPGIRWRFEPRATPLATATISDGDWTRTHFRESLESEGRLNEVSGAIVRGLPKAFRSSEIERAISGVPAELAQRHDTRNDLDAIRTMAWSTYHADFDPATELTQRVLLPAAAEETNGVEDARFVLFTDDDGSVEYRATYTAYDGHSIAPRLIVSPDLCRFSIHRLSGPAAVNKGMALFPRRIDGTRYAVTRTDGENVSVARSHDGLSWADVAVVHRPTELWEIVQSGNCGSPIETDRGWLVILHGVGPMRQYAIGALLLDLDDPTVVRAVLDTPILVAGPELREGYVPNVVYSCGGVVHDGRLWLPYGVGDSRVRVASISVAALLDEMAPAPVAA